MDKREKQPKPLPMGSSGKKTILTAIVYYSHKLNGQPYSYAEKQAKENRFFHPSFDYIVTEKGETLTTHHKAWEKILGMIQRRSKTIITALVHCNMPDGTEYRVAKFSKHKVEMYAKPVYGIGDKLNDVVIRSWSGNPMRMERREVA